jgi:predicted dehydrogenase
MSNDLDRRRFMGAAAVSGACTIVPRHVLGGTGHVAPSDKVTLAHIGMGTQGFREIGDLLADPKIRIVAVCDPNRESDDYVEWGKGGILSSIRELLGNPSWRKGQTGCVGGREVGRQVVDAYYAQHRGDGRGKGCRAYADFRELLEQEPDVDAVKIMTPDHLHATISIAAMKKGKHVLMHKPIANRFHEGRQVLKTARETGCATHLLAYGSGTGNGLIAEQVKAGVIGTLLEVHNWTNRPVWPQYTEIPKDTPPIPDGFEWQLWLGPERDRPYHHHYTHTVFRGWYDFGGGSMADMGIYSLWPVFTSLDLGVPVSAKAWATHTCTIENNVSRRVNNDFAYPTACAIRFQFAPVGNRPAVELFWYDGGMKPRMPREVETQDVEMGAEGILFVGDQGSILGSFRGQSPRLFKDGKHEPLAVARTEQPAKRHASWLDACQGGDASPGSFLDAAAITDTVNLGTVALRAGREVLLDSENMRITNSSQADRFLYRQYREGWEL